VIIDYYDHSLSEEGVSLFYASVSVTKEGSPRTTETSQKKELFIWRWNYRNWLPYYLE